MLNSCGDDVKSFLNIFSTTHLELAEVVGVLNT